MTEDDIGTTFDDDITTSSTAAETTTSTSTTGMGPSSSVPTTTEQSSTDPSSTTESEAEAEAEAESETTGPPGSGFSLLGFGQFSDTVTGFVFTENGIESEETIDVPFHVSAATSDGSQYFVMLRERAGGGGLVTWPLDLDLASLQAPQIFGVTVDSSNLFTNSAVSDDYVVFTSNSADPLVCDRNDATSCQGATTPQAIIQAACSDDGSCIGGGGDVGTMRSADGGLTWDNLADQQQPNSVVAGPGGVYALYDFANSVVRSSDDGGQTWTDAAVPAGADNILPLVYFVDTFAGGRFTFSSTGIFLSSGGDTWEEIEPVVEVGINNAALMPDIEVALFYNGSDGAGFIMKHPYEPRDGVQSIVPNTSLSQLLFAKSIGTWQWRAD